MIENDRWCISVYFSRTWRLKSQDIGRFWRRCCSLPPMHLHVAGNSSPWIRLSRKLWSSWGGGPTTKTRPFKHVFFSNRKSHHSRCTSNKSLSNAVAAWKTCQTCCCFFVFFWGGFSQAQGGEIQSISALLGALVLHGFFLVEVVEDEKIEASSFWMQGSDTGGGTLSRLNNGEAFFKKIKIPRPIPMPLSYFLRQR